jgi:hypothetical protein
MRHDFGDTKHHEVYYSLQSTTRFLEYFTATATAALHGTAAVRVSAAGFAHGTVVVTGTGADLSRTYALDSDYIENDAAGTIARASSSTIPDGAKVQVTYVAPPVTRSSLEAAAHPPTPKGVLLNIPSSQRPPAPDMLYAVPLFGWQRGSSATQLTSTRAGNMLRVYLGRPWFQSGDGELLGVIVANPVPAGTTFPSDLAQYVSGYGDDPIVTTGASAPSQFKLTDFTLAKSTGNAVLLTEQSDARAWVGVAGHEVAWDPVRELWYADIAMTLAPSYFPFVKLALVRYQPSSVPGVEVSTVVQADLIQVAPNRTMTLTFPNPNSVRVTVSGPGYRATADPATPSVMLAYVQGPRTSITDPDLTWATYPAYANGIPLPVTSQTDTVTTWAATVKLPFARGFKRLRVLVAENEQHRHVGSDVLDSRVTYLDAVEI